MKKVESTFSIPNVLDDIIYDLDDVDHELGYGFVITNVDFPLGSIDVTFQVNTGASGKEVNGEWQLSIKNYRKYRIDDAWSDYGFEVYDIHPLLLEYKEDKVSLYFSTGSENPDKLLSDVYKAHRAVCGEHIPVEYFLSNTYLHEACYSKFGLFAKGPVSLLDEYKAVLEAHKMKCNFQGRYKPKYWHGDKLLPEPEDIKLLILGDSYFIGQNFEFKKLQ